MKDCSKNADVGTAPPRHGDGPGTEPPPKPLASAIGHRQGPPGPELMRESRVDRKRRRRGAARSVGAAHPTLAHNWRGRSGTGGALQAENPMKDCAKNADVGSAAPGCGDGPGTEPPPKQLAASNERHQGLPDPELTRERMADRKRRRRSTPRPTSGAHRTLINNRRGRTGTGGALQAENPMKDCAKIADVGCAAPGCGDGPGTEPPHKRLASTDNQPPGGPSRLHADAGNTGRSRT